MRRKHLLLSLLLLLVGVVSASAAIGDEIVYDSENISLSSWCYDDGVLNYPPSAINDDNTESFWHSNYGNSPNIGLSGGGVPHWIIIDLGETKSIGGFGYRPRNTTSNGLAKAYKFYVSDVPFTDAAWGVTTPCTTAAERDVVKNLAVTPNSAGSWTWSTADMKNVALETKAEGRYVMFVITEGEGGYGNCAEFNVYAWDDDNKPLLIEKISEFQASVTAAGAASTEVGYFSAEKLAAANQAISDAQNVVNNEASTNEEEADAISELESAVAAFQPNPVVAGIYKINLNSVTKPTGEYSVYDNGTKLAWKAFEEDDLTCYWFVEETAGGFTVKNAAYQTYMADCAGWNGSFTLVDDPQIVEFDWLKAGQFNVVVDGGMLHAAGSGNASGEIVYWNTGADNASAWTLVPVAEIPEYVVNAWEWIHADMEDVLRPGARVSTLENGKQYFVFNTSFNGNEDRSGFLLNNGSGFGLEKTLPSELHLTTNAQLVSHIWTVETTGESDVYYLKTYDDTYVEGEYINIKGAHSSEPQKIYIKEFSTFENITGVENEYAGVAKSGVSSLAEDETTRVASANISTGNKVWAVYNNIDFSGNNVAWNGTANAFDTWAEAHPYAFYEVVTVSKAEILAAANEAIAKTGVGYPKENATERTELSEAISGGANAVQLQEKLDAYLASTDVQMPEDGKAYTITSVNFNGVQRYMNYTEGTGYGLVDRTDAPLPMTAVLICRKVAEGKYAFVNNAGKYFMWRGENAGQNSVKGYSDTYDATNENSNTVLTVEKLTVGGNVSGTQDALFGYMAMKGNRNNGSTPNYFVIKTGGNYSQADQKYFNSGFSSALLIEEVSYPNTPAVSASIDDVFVGTFAAPYPAVVPEGVTAYEITGKRSVEGADYINCSVLAEAGDAIPAGAGVLLVSSKSEASVTMLPATTETVATAGGNLLERATGEAISESTTAYILADGSNGVGFYLLGDKRTVKMNKAYLTGLSSGAVLKLNFGGNLTGIDSIDNGELTIDNGTVYDLSGRVVNAPVKGGIYIKNGKKYIVK